MGKTDIIIPSLEIERLGLVKKPSLIHQAYSRWESGYSVCNSLIDSKTRFDTSTRNRYQIKKKTLYSSNQIKSQVSFLENQNSKLSFFLFFFDSHSIQIHQLTRLGTVIFFFLIHFQFTCGWESKPTEKRSKFDTIYIELSQRESWHQFELRERVERKVQTV